MLLRCGESNPAIPLDHGRAASKAPVLQIRDRPPAAAIGASGIGLG